MNCIGHTFQSNKDILLRTKAFLDQITSPRFLLTTDDIHICKATITFKTNRVIEGKTKMFIKNKEWVEEFTTDTVTICTDGNIQLENIIIQLKSLLRKDDVILFNLITKSIYYKGFDELTKVYKVHYQKDKYPRTNEDFKALILDYELSS